MGQVAISWVMLIGAGLLEIVWALGLKHMNGAYRFVPVAITVLAYIASFILLSKCVKFIPVSTAYVVWTGIGAVGTTVVGAIIEKESINILQYLCIGLIIIGTIGLKSFGTKM